MKSFFHGIAYAFLIIVVAGIGAAIASFFVTDFWWLDLATHFYFQYFLLLLVPLFIFLLSQKIVQTVFTSLLFLLTLVAIAPPFLPEQYWTPITPQDIITIYTANIKSDNNDLEKILLSLQDAQPDIIFLTEINDNVYKQLVEKLPEYQNHLLAVGSSSYLNIAYFSKLTPTTKVKNLSLVSKDAGTIPTLELKIQNGDNFITFLALHTYSPLSERNVKWRNEHLRNLGKHADEITNPVVVVGDFNTSTWSSNIQPLRQAELRDGRAGFGLEPSWPVWLPYPLRLTIDHTYVSPNIRVAERYLGLETGSDHFPVIIKLKVEEKKKIF